MGPGATASGREEPAVLDRWSARKISPIVVFYVAAVFAAFIALSLLVFHSADAVKALLIAAVGTVAATAPSVMEKVEYRMTGLGIEKRVKKRKDPGRFKDVFRWNELSHIVPMKRGFKYYKTMNEKNPLRRFWKMHISDQFSGEVQVGKTDLERVVEGARRCRRAGGQEQHH
jgi:hypothetical protein